MGTKWPKTQKCLHCGSTKPVRTKEHHRKHMKSKKPLPCMDGCLLCEKNNERLGVA